jgi:hypothetical protein
MFYKCAICKKDVETDSIETHFHLKLTKDVCGIENDWLELTLCEDCFKFKIKELNVW